ncbi:hypothetical protein D3C77_663580 [compost metagenome]
MPLRVSPVSGAVMVLLVSGPVPLALVWLKVNMPLLALPANSPAKFKPLSIRTLAPSRATLAPISAVLSCWKMEAVSVVFSQAIPDPTSMIARRP